MNLQVEQSEVTVVPATYTMRPVLKFTEAQKVNDEKLYSTKDFFDACAKVAVAAPVAQPIGRG